MLSDKGVTETGAVARIFGACGPFFLWLFPAVSLLLAILLGRAWAIYSPDSNFYRMLALGERAAVPAPFSARILGPALAQWVGSFTGLGVDSGFMVLGICSLVAFLAAMMYLLRFQGLPAGIFAAIFLMPFWVELFHDYYLPDLLHAAILAALLVCLASERITLAMLLLFPAYLARESTLLIALCLVWAAWRRVSIRAIAAGFLATMAGILVSRHFVQLGALNAEGMSGARYLSGKIAWSFLRNIFGLSLWANSMPRAIPACRPAWSAVLPHGIHLGPVYRIGLCAPSLWGPARVLLAWFGIFGIGPAVATAYIRAITSRRAMSGDFWLERNSSFGKRSAGAIIAFRFCVVYGILTLVLAPLLGASVDRLVGYAWPFYFIALPWVVCGLAAARPYFARRRGLWLLLLHLAACWIAWRAFSREYSTHFYLYAGLIALGLNIVAYLAVSREMRGRWRQNPS